MKTKSIIKNSKLPKFITTHDIFTKIDKVEKVFPLIGLTNRSVSISTLDYGNHKVAGEIKNRLMDLFNNKGYYLDEWDNDKLRVKVYAAIRESKLNDFLIKGRLTTLPSQLRKLGIKNINDTYYAARYASKQRQKSAKCWDGDVLKLCGEKPGLKIVFSSDKSKGLWDIATMSERGISSCQSWDGSYRRNLVGSIIDPFLGIIYLTDGTPCSNKGEKMIKRALVRYVLNRKTQRPALLLEHVYSKEGTCHNSELEGNSEAKAIFTCFLKKFANKGIDVVTTARNHTIPNSTPVKTLEVCKKYLNDAVGNGDCKSYRDSGIAYAKSSSVGLRGIKSF
jgi:hypothetical protein